MTAYLQELGLVQIPKYLDDKLYREAVLCIKEIASLHKEIQSGSRLVKVLRYRLPTRASGFHTAQAGLENGDRSFIIFL